ncbi:DUF1453 domain-containing protein [Streptomyces sp. NPDC088197]|uniref:DUF1453 domain-containing protein n=1 Tax=unclassified Streptomyces TaxID=2593676 RepID=UPI0033BD1F9B
MSGLIDALVIVAVIGVVVTRQLRPRKVTGGRRWWLIPAVLVFMALRQHGLIDPEHRQTAVALLAVELVVAVGMGLAWAWTTRLWTERDGTVWAQGGKVTVAVWAAGVAVRIGLYGVGTAMGVHQDSGSFLIALAATLLIRAGVLAWRAQSVAPSYRTAS